MCSLCGLYMYIDLMWTPCFHGDSIDALFIERRKSHSHAGGNPEMCIPRIPAAQSAGGHYHVLFMWFIHVHRPHVDPVFPRGFDRCFIHRAKKKSFPRRWESRDVQSANPRGAVRGGPLPCALYVVYTCT